MIKIYKEILNFFYFNLKNIIIIASITELPVIILDRILRNKENSQSPFIIIIIALISVAIANTALTILFSAILKQEKADIKKIISKSFKYLPKMITAMVAYALAIILGLICFIIPGIIIGARLSFYNYYIIYEEMEPLDSLNESFQATKGFTFEISMLYIIMFFFVAIIQLILAFNYFTASIPFLSILTDYISFVIRSIILIMTFRVYCLVKEKNGVYFDK